MFYVVPMSTEISAMLTSASEFHFHLPKFMQAINRVRSHALENAVEIHFKYNTIEIRYDNTLMITDIIYLRITFNKATIISTIKITQQ